MGIKSASSLTRCIILISMLMIANFGTSAASSQINQKGHPAQYRKIDPIAITGNAQLADFSSAGDGTSTNPYIINRIMVRSLVNCLVLSNITAHAIIANSYFSGYGINILMRNVTNILLNNCTLEGGNFGLYLSRNHNVSVQDCTIAGNEFPITLESSSNITIQSSRIYGGETGAFFDESRNITLSQNKIYGNILGIHLDSETVNCSITQNEVGWNAESNAHDDGEDNRWWDEEQGGNLWSDFTGTETYDIEGNAGSVDEDPNFLGDLQSPQILGPQDELVVQGETYLNLTWIAEDAYPLTRQFILDGNTEDNETWVNRTITIHTGELEIGTHNYTMIFYDAKGNSITDVVLVTVIVSIFGGLGTTILLASSIISVLGVIIVIFILKRTS